jgi:O-antigen/teichoic acid export membrane protein
VDRLKKLSPYWTYLAAIGIQKGMPFLLIPLIVRVFGQDTYAEYILVFSTAQFASLAMGLGTTGSPIVFWHRYPDHERVAFLRALISLVVKVHAFTIIPVGTVLWLVGQPRLGNDDQFHWIGIALLFAISNNGLQILLNIVRAREQATKYLLAVMVGAGAFVGLIVLVGNFVTSTLALTLCYLATMVLQALALALSQRDVIRSQRQAMDPNALTRSVLGYALPISGYTLLSLSFVVGDKWLMSRVSPGQAFSQYVVDFQLANAVALVSVVLGLHFVPYACSLVNKGRLRELRRTVLQHYVTCLVGGGLIGLGAYAYGTITGLTLTRTFFILCAAFCLNNVFTINVAVMESRLAVRELLRRTLFPTVIFWLVMLYLGPSAAVWLPTGYVAYYGFLALWTSFSINTWFIKEIPAGEEI